MLSYWPRRDGIEEERKGGRESGPQKGKKEVHAEQVPEGRASRILERVC